jgi:carbon monoxide dehydrogenase subunit G
MITVRAELTLSRDVPASPDEAFALLRDAPDSIAHFPRDLEALTPEGDGWRWTMKKAGVGQVSVQMIYAVRYAPDAEARRITWTPIAGVGNAEVRGTWTVEPCGSGSRLTLHNCFDVQLGLPRIARRLAEPIVRHENGRMMRAYVANLATTLAGGDGRVTRRFAFVRVS